MLRGPTWGCWVLVTSAIWDVDVRGSHGLRPGFSKFKVSINHPARLPHDDAGLRHGECVRQGVVAQIMALGAAAWMLVCPTVHPWEDVFGFSRVFHAPALCSATW